MFVDPKTWTERQRQASDALIRRGSVRHLLHQGQRLFYDLVKANPSQKEFFFYTSRRFGKSFALALMGIEHCLGKPNRLVRHIFPIFKTAKAAVFDLMSQIDHLLPPDCKPILKRSEATYIFPNGSRYVIGGSSPETIQSNRGVDMTLLLADEVAFWDESCFNELLYSILYPQMLHYPDAQAMFVTTPPVSQMHPVLTDVLPRVVRNNCFIKATIYDNPLLTSEQIEGMKAMVGGEQSNAWRREFMAEFVASDDRRVVPEFNREKHVYAHPARHKDEFDNPVAYHGLVVADYGVSDYAGILNGWYDHNKNLLVVEHEHMERLMGLRALDIKLTEFHKLLPWTCEREEVVDMFEQAGLELRREFGRTFRYPTKAKVEDQVALVRNAFQAGRIAVNPRCVQLINMLEQGLWKETEKNKDFERSDAFGHLDLLSALCYMVKRCPWGRRPDAEKMNLKFGRFRK